MSTKRNSTHRTRNRTFPARRASYITPGRSRKRCAYRHRERFAYAIATFFIFAIVFNVVAWSQDNTLDTPTFIASGVWGLIGTTLYLLGTQ